MNVDLGPHLILKKGEALDEWEHTAKLLVSINYNFCTCIRSLVYQDFRHIQYISIFALNYIVKVALLISQFLNKYGIAVTDILVDWVNRAVEAPVDTLVAQLMGSMSSDTNKVKLVDIILVGPFHWTTYWFNWLQGVAHRGVHRLGWGGWGRIQTQAWPEGNKAYEVRSMPTHLVNWAGTGRA